MHLAEIGIDPRSGSVRMQRHRLSGPDGDPRDEYYFIASMETLRELARRTGKYGGTLPPVFEDNEDGSARSCTVEVVRTDWNARASYSVELSYLTGFRAQGEPGGFLDRSQRDQLAAIAESGALRQAFLHEIGSLYYSVEDAHVEAVVNEATAREDAQ